MRLSLALLASFLFVSSGFSQTLSPGAFQGFPGYWNPLQGAPFSHRYNYDSGSAIYLGGNSSNLYLMDYLDKLDRAQKFGHALPKPPAQIGVLGEAYAPTPQDIVEQPAILKSRYRLFRR